MRVYETVDGVPQAYYDVDDDQQGTIRQMSASPTHLEPFARALEGAVARAEGSEESCELRLYRVPALNFEALWLSYEGGKGDQLVPLTPVGPLPTGEPVPFAEAVTALREAAKPLADMDDTMGVVTRAHLISPGLAAPGPLASDKGHWPSGPGVAGSLTAMTSLSDAAADRPAEPALFAGLVDDAAVFPPGNAPLAEAVRRHRLHRASGYAACVGPLLVPASAAADLVGPARRCTAAGRGHRASRHPGRPGGRRRGAAARRPPGVEVAGVELGWTPDWRSTDFGGIPRTPRGAARPRSRWRPSPTSPLTPRIPLRCRRSSAPARPRRGPGRTRPSSRPSSAPPSTTTSASSSPAACTTWSAAPTTAQEQHGLLNVLAAVRWALNGEEVDELVPILAERDPAVLVPQVVRMSAADAAIVRAFFTAYGCCEVTDPLGELTTLGLIQGA